MTGLQVLESLKKLEQQANVDLFLVGYIIPVVDLLMEQHGQQQIIDFKPLLLEQLAINAEQDSLNDIDKAELNRLVEVC